VGFARERALPASGLYFPAGMDGPAGRARDGDVSFRKVVRLELTGLWPVPAGVNCSPARHASPRALKDLYPKDLYRGRPKSHHAPFTAGAGSGASRLSARPHVWRSRQASCRNVATAKANAYREAGARGPRARATAAGRWGRFKEWTA